MSYSWFQILRRRLPAAFLTVAILFLAIPPAHAREKAVIQLKWLHHFQFAGYYMALEKGFYSEAGLDVTILEGGPNIDVDKEVAAGRADFGTGTSALLLNLAQGQDVVVLGQVFQHSPAIFLTPRKTGIRSVRDMSGRRFMQFTQHGDMQALLKKNGIEADQIVKVPQKGDPRDLIEGKADVMLAYSFNEPYIMELTGEPYFTFSPLSFGIDFYGDNLFTTGRLVKARPGFVKAFREASLRGWHYALENKAETVDLILSKYPGKMSREHLLFEADNLDVLIQPTLVELGYQSHSRWQRISETFADLGMIPKGVDPAPIIYTNAQSSNYRPLLVITLIAAAIISVLTWLALTFRRLNVNLEKQIEERRQAEEALTESEERFRSLLETISSVAVQGYYLDGTVHFWNQASERLYGYSAAEALGAKLLDLIIPSAMQAAVIEAIRQMQESNEPIPAGELLLQRKDGSMVAVFSSHALLKPAGRQAELFCLDIDLTERKQAEALLRESDERFRLAFENANIGMCLVDTQGKFFKVNRQMCGIFGYSKEELEGMTVNDITHPDYRGVSTGFIRQAAIGEIDHFELEKGYCHKLGRLVWGQVSSSLVRTAEGEPLYFISHVIDITKRKQAEEERLSLERQMLQAQKLESLGVLAGGIAHDFNNIIMAIIGNADLALLKLNPGSPLVTNLQQIEQAAMRAADLAKQMLAYSGKGKFRIENLDLNRLLEEMLQMLEVSISKKALLRFNLAPDLPAIEADATQIRQIIMNLVINASEAIGDDSGIITITTGSMECDKNYLQEVWLNDNGSDGLYIYLEIADSGCGMDNETVGRLFDPFFSTKFTGRGLGMSAVQGIVRGHLGAIKVYSEPGKGTIFKVLLPAAVRPVEILGDASCRDDWQGSGIVLLVDDEELVRGVGAELLKALGFTVVTANDGVAAVAVFKSRKDIDLVILDLTMPHMDGEECFRELRQIYPGVKVIISSGYSEHEIEQKFVGLGLTGFIQKPYALSALREVLKVTV